MPDQQSPRGSLAIRTLAMPADTNPDGDIFGGWLLGTMDVAGGVTARARAHGRAATVAVDAMSFHRPVRVGDVVCCYTEVARVGRTSIAVRIEAWALRKDTTLFEKVTEGTFTYVAIDAAGRKRPVPGE